MTKTTIALLTALTLSTAYASDLEDGDRTPPENPRLKEAEGKLVRFLWVKLRDVILEAGVQASGAAAASAGAVSAEAEAAAPTFADPFDVTPAILCVKEDADGFEGLEPFEPLPGTLKKAESPATPSRKTLNPKEAARLREIDSMEDADEEDFVAAASRQGIPVLQVEASTAAAVAADPNEKPVIPEQEGVRLGANLHIPLPADEKPRPLTRTMTDLSYEEMMATPFSEVFKRKESIPGQGEYDADDE